MRYRYATMASEGRQINKILSKDDQDTKHWPLWKRKELRPPKSSSCLLVPEVCAQKYPGKICRLNLIQAEGRSK